MREWAFFLPAAPGLGFALHFISFFPRHPSLGHSALALVVVFFLTAVPEDIFFRGILQNLLEGRYRERARRQLLASSTSHTLVDVVWGLWFR